MDVRSGQWTPEQDCPQFCMVRRVHPDRQSDDGVTTAASGSFLIWRTNAPLARVHGRSETRYARPARPAARPVRGPQRRTRRRAAPRSRRPSEIIDKLAGLHHLQAELIEVVRLGGHLATAVGAEPAVPPKQELSEGFERRRIIASASAGWLHQILSLLGFWAPVGWDYNWGDVDTDLWIDRQRVVWEYGIGPGIWNDGPEHFRDFYVEFHDIALLAASDGGIWYGDPHTVAAQSQELRGQAFIIDLEQFDHDTEHSISRTETLTRSVSHTMDRKFTSSTTAELSGSIPGTGFEAKVSETLGFELDNSTTESMDTSVSQTLSDSLISPRRRKTLILFNKTNQKIVTPFRLNAIYDFGFGVNWPKWNHAWGHGNTWQWRIGVAGLQRRPCLLEREELPRRRRLAVVRFA